MQDAFGTDAHVRFTRKGVLASSCVTNASHKIKYKGSAPVSATVRNIRALKGAPLDVTQHKRKPPLSIFAGKKEEN